MKVYAGFNKNKEIINSASGGIAIALYEHCIANKFIVVGAKYTEDMYNAEYDFASDILDICKFQGSKYFFVKKNNIFQKVVNLIERGNNVLFIGLPCEIAGIKRLVENIKDSKIGKLFTVDLICHGTTYPEVHEQYIKYLERKYKSKAISINTRKVKKYWEQPYYEVVFENGKVFSKQLYDTEFGYFFSRICRSSCFSCNFKGENSYADITIGDYWGVTENDICYNRYGTSVIICHTKVGEELIKSCDSIALFDISLENAVKRNPNILQSKQKSVRYEDIKNNFKRYGIIEGAKRSYSSKEKVRKFLKKFIPNDLLYKIKWGK